MTRVYYLLDSGRKVKTLMEAKTSGEPYYIYYEEVIKHSKKISPLRKLILETKGKVLRNHSDNC